MIGNVLIRVLIVLALPVRVVNAWNSPTDISEDDDESNDTSKSSAAIETPGQLHPKN